MLAKFGTCCRSRHPIKAMDFRAGVFKLFCDPRHDSPLARSGLAPVLPALGTGNEGETAVRDTDRPPAGIPNVSLSR